MRAIRWQPLSRPGRCARVVIVGAVAAIASLATFWGLATASAASTPIPLLVPQSTAFSVLGHSCGGIQEKAFATGFGAGGYPVGDVSLTTTCSSGGRGSRPTTYAAWVATTWDFSGTLTSYTKLATAPTGLNPTFSATDAHGDTIYNSLSRAYLTVPVPAAPTAVKAVQAGDQFQVTWAPAPATAPVITSSTITATPVGSPAPVLTATVTGSAKTGLIGPLQPLTSYQITVVSTDAGGSGPASSAITAKSAAASIPPSAPTGVSAIWTAPGNGPGDNISASWAAATPGNSPIDQYQVTASNYGGDTGPVTLTQTVTGSTLGAILVADDTLDWSVQVRAHNAVGWGPWSAAVTLYASN